MSEIVEDLKIANLELTDNIGINFSGEQANIAHNGSGDFYIESEISPIIIRTEAGCSGNANIVLESSHNGCDAILMLAEDGYINAFSQGQINVVGDIYEPLNQAQKSLSPQNANLLQNIKSKVVKNVIAKSPYGEQVLTSLNKNQPLNANNLNPACDNDLPDGVMFNIASNFIGIFSEGQETSDNDPSIVIEACNGEIIISADGATSNADILIHANGEIHLDVDQQYENILLTTTNTGVVIAPGKFEAGTVFQEYQPTTSPPSYGLLVPTGAVIPYAGGSAPAGWLLCNGASLLRTEYSTLFATIGTTYGSVDGTHFTIPDLRSRLPLGGGAGPGLTARTLGVSGGQENITTVPEHSHSINFFNDGSYAEPSTVGDAFDYVRVSGSAQLNTNNTGTNGGVNVMNPFLILNYIIKV